MGVLSFQPAVMSCSPGLMMLFGTYVLLLVRYQSGDVVNYNTDIVRVNRFLVCMCKHSLIGTMGPHVREDEDEGRGAD